MRETAGLNARTKYTVVLAIALLQGAATAEEPKLPIESDDSGSVYIAPLVTSTEASAQTNGAKLGVENKDGSGTVIGIDTSTSRPVYSIEKKTGGDVSLDTGLTTDGKANNGIKAGVTIKY